MRKMWVQSESGKAPAEENGNLLQCLFSHNLSSRVYCQTFEHLSNCWFTKCGWPCTKMAVNHCSICCHRWIPHVPCASTHMPLPYTWAAAYSPTPWIRDDLVNCQQNKFEVMCEFQGIWTLQLSFVFLEPSSHSESLEEMNKRPCGQRSQWDQSRHNSTCDCKRYRTVKQIWKRTKDRNLNTNSFQDILWNHNNWYIQYWYQDR